jgi:hypothetical protein
LKFCARCLINSLCSTPGNAISTALSKPLQAFVCTAKPGGVPIMLRNCCRNQTQLSSDSASTTPNATGNSQFCPSTAEAATSYPLHLPVKWEASTAKYGLQPSRNPCQQALKQTKALLKHSFSNDFPFILNSNVCLSISTTLLSVFWIPGYPGPLAPGPRHRPIFSPGENQRSKLRRRPSRGGAS